MGVSRRATPDIPICWILLGNIETPTKAMMRRGMKIIDMKLINRKTSNEDLKTSVLGHDHCLPLK